MNTDTYVLAELKRELADRQNDDKEKFVLLYPADVLALIAGIEADAVLGDGVET